MPLQIMNSSHKLPIPLLAILVTYLPTTYFMPPTAGITEITSLREENSCLHSFLHLISSHRIVHSPIRLSSDHQAGHQPIPHPSLLTHHHLFFSPHLVPFLINSFLPSPNPHHPLKPIPSTPTHRNRIEKKICHAR